MFDDICVIRTRRCIAQRPSQVVAIARASSSGLMFLQNPHRGGCDPDGCCDDFDDDHSFLPDVQSGVYQRSHTWTDY